MTLGKEPAPRSISVVVPAYAETGLALIWDAFSAAPDTEVIFALAEGDLATQAPAGAVSIRSQKGRARQMNAGASIAKGDILVFLHADTVIPPDSLDSVRRALADPGVSAGAYRLRVDGKGWFFSFISAAANLRSRLLKMPFGDQSIFIRGDIFRKIGGFEDAPILEDVLLMKKAGKLGRIAVIPVAAVTSARRWEQEGIYITTLRHWGIMLAYFMGAAPETISRWFKR